MADVPLTGKVAFVSGGIRGIGGAISEALAADGCDVAMGFAGNTEKANAMLEKLQSSYPNQKFSVHRGDVADGETCRKVIADTIEQHGRLDILVNNAGITRDKVVLKMEDADWEAVLATNLGATFYLSQASLRHMVERGTGRIIIISSLIGEAGGIGQANYGSSKAGQFGLTKALATEAIFHAKRAGTYDPQSIGLTVNCIAPGYVLTEMVQTIPEKVMEKLVAGIPVGRMAQPSEVGRLVRFLAADESSFMTGHIFDINGGQYMN